MIPWEHLDSGAIPGEPGELRLMRRGTEYAILIGGNALMNSRLSGSERALARLACERLASRRSPRLLIGGLGMGFTLRAALDGLKPEAAVEVAELVPAVIAWARGPLAHLFAGSLEDPRVILREEDVGQRMAAERARYDAILLDVDNGPEGRTRRENDRLYGLEGLSLARAALRPGGVLGVWSQGPDAAFTGRLRRAGFRVEETTVRAHAGGGRRHTLWLATPATEPPARAAPRPPRGRPARSH